MDSAVELENVTLLRGGATLLDRLDWRVERGENWAVLGPNGAGKTLLLQVVTGYVWPTEGSARVLGRKLGRVDLRELRKKIGWVSATAAELIPWRTTLIETILSGPAATLGVYEEPGDELRAKALELALSFGLSEITERPFRLLSSGEKQRTLLARASLAEPELLILDEPMSNLDMGGRELFLEKLRLVTERENPPTVILTTHNTLEIAPFFGHALLVKKGRDLARGAISEIMTAKNLSEAFDLDLLVEVSGTGRYLATLNRAPEE
ncbi:MAG: ATP-binding cassette domain-containing protein [Deltaproteobacteria bacterium]|jgi:iron complex transport system ATP-binding protein|nr:ATP-binding cassette domain-containing protein [Deltaproteobacteria bacterium]